MVWHFCKCMYLSKLPFSLIFNMERPIERMHQTEYKCHTQTIMTLKLYSIVCFQSTCPLRFISDAKWMAKWMLPFMFPDTIHHKFAMILISGFLADNRRLVALSRMSWLILFVRGFTQPRIKTVLSTNAWLSTCGSTWGLTISSICSLCT